MAKKLGRLARSFPDKIMAALFVLGEDIMLVSKRDFVPVDLGTLRGTGTVLPARRERGTRVVVQLVYGGPSAPYAIVQHENTDFDPHKVGESKYLEKPLLARASTAARELAQLLDLDRTAKGI